MSNLKGARKGALVLSAVAMLAFASSALASGTNSGGVNSGGVNSGGGTTTTTTSTTTSGSCARITGFSNSTGYYSVWAAIWTQFSIQTSSCVANWQMTYTNGNTGAVDFARGSSTAYMTSGTVDEDWAAFSTPYTVALTVTDPYTGAVLASQSAVVNTKAPKTGA